MNEITSSTNSSLEANTKRAFLSQSLLGNFDVCLELLDPPYTKEGIIEKARRMTEGKKIPKDFEFKVSEDAHNYRSESSDFAVRFALKMGIIFWDNQTQYDASKSLDNIAAVTSPLDLPTTMFALSKIDELISYEKKMFPGESTPNNITITPYLLEKVLPRLSDVKAEDRPTKLDELVKNARVIVYNTSKDTRRSYAFDEVRKENRDMLEDYADSIGLKKPSDGNRFLDYRRIEAIVKGDEILKTDNIHMNYGGIRESNGGDVKIFVDGQKPVSVHLVRGKTRDVARVLVDFGERYVLPNLQPNSAQYKDTNQALIMLKGHFL